MEALRRSLAERESALAHAVRELSHAQRDSQAERSRAERHAEALAARAARLEEESARQKAELDQLRKGADAAARKRTVFLEDRLRAAQARAAEASAAYEDRARSSELATAEWHRLAAELSELRARIARFTRPPPPQALLTPGAVARLTEAARKLRCPRCSGSMTEYQHASVRADKCDDCFGIFFDNGELEHVIAQNLEVRDEQWAAFGELLDRTRTA